MLLLFVTVTEIRCYELLCLNGQRKIKERSKVLEAMMIIKMIMLDISMPEMMIMIMPEMMIMMKLEMMMMFKLMFVMITTRVLIVMMIR